MSENCLRSQYNTKDLGNQGKIRGTPESTYKCWGNAAVLIEDEELTANELLRFSMQELERIWEGQAYLIHEIKKTNQTLTDIKELLR